MDETTLDRELRAIEDSSIFCASHVSLNDPMEGGHRLSALFAKSRSSEIERKNVQRAVTRMGIASFSEIKNHETMWAHYADNFRGICVSYKTGYLKAGLPDNIDIVKMNYSEEPPVLLRNSETPERRAKLALSYKTLRWSHEREWRVFADRQGLQSYKDAHAVSAVYIGARVSDEVRKLIARRMARIGVACYVMRIDTYKLKFAKVVCARRKS